MKKIIALMICVCLCAAAFASCGDYSDASTSASTTASTVDTGSTQNTGAQTGTTAAGGTTGNAQATGNNNQTTGAGQTTGTPGSTGTGNSQTTGSTVNPENGNVVLDKNGYPDETKADSIKGERITEEQWNTVLKGEYTNYTYTYVDGTVGGSVGTKMNVKLAGDTYERNVYSKGVLSSRTGRFLIDGALNYFEYDISTGAWIVLNNYSFTHNYPLKGFPIAFSDLVYNEATGAYRVEGMSMGGDAKVNMEFRFKDGYCVYVRMEQCADGSNTANLAYQMFVFAKYGETSVTSFVSGNLNDFVVVPGGTTEKK
jgi:hypothetical protein